MVVANNGSEAAECDVRRDFGGGKVVALEIQKAWRGPWVQGGNIV